jgi:hypothetical protein
MRMPSLPWRKDETVLGPPRPESTPEDELKGCWRIFGIVIVLLVVIVLGMLGYRFAFVWQPWKGTADRAADVQAELLASLPERMPDILGKSLVDGLYVLTEAGYPQILLFTSEMHGVEPSKDLGFNPGLPVDATRPAPGEPPTLTVTVWVGERPAPPRELPVDAWWFPHEETTRDRGTYQCLACHTPESCTVCHEERLRGADATFLSDPEAAPELAKALTGALGVEVDHLLAVYRGSGWYRVDVLLDEPEEPRAVAAAAIEAAVTAFPAGFSAEPDAETLVLRWVDAGALDPIVEIGLERATYESVGWMTIEPEDIPWVADRYIVATRRE